MIMSVADAGAVRLKVPSAFVVVPDDVPLIVIEALGTGFPFSSVILPVIVFCAITVPIKNRNAVNNKR